ncbi:Oxygen regulatory protein NreC [Thalassocella blandensis]|nr:Oxygen regulatory protein NreC [Thalassocella blandensis]
MNMHQGTDSTNVNNIMVIAEQPVVTEGMKCIIESVISLNMFTAAHSFDEARRSVSLFPPSIIILDTTFGKDDVLTFIKWVKDFSGQIKIILLTDSKDNELCVDAFKTGARGCCLKNASPEQILHSLRMVQEGRILLDEGFMNVLVNLGNNQNEEAKLNNTLKPRDIDILNLVARGNTNQDISNQIFISSRTVQGHLSKIFSKLGVKSRTEAVSKAIQLGILKQEQINSCSLSQ